MARTKKVQYVELTPKSDAGKKRLDYHGEKWCFSEEKEVVKFSMETGWIAVRSRDGKKSMYVKKVGDADFNWRML